MKLVCIPAYNEEKIIGVVVKACLKFSDKVVVCDDGSTDKTSLKAEEAGATVINHSKNKGKGSALQSLFSFSKKIPFDVMITIDGDGQFLPEEIEKISKPIQDGTADIVIGYRFDNNVQMPSYRKLGNKFFDKMTKLASELQLRDTQSGFRAYSKKAVDTINFSTNGFGADSEILIDASKKRLKIVEEKVTVIYDTGGQTSKKNPISHSSDVFGSLLEHIVLKHPLRFLGIPGIILMIIGLIFSIIVISIFNDIRYFSIPSTLVALGSLMVGLMLFLMSMVLFAIQRAFKKN